MHRPFRLAAAPALALLIAGCTAARHSLPPAAPAAEVRVVAVSPPAPEPPSASIPAAPEPVYRNPKIGVVYLRAHQDAQGRLLGPQVMYQVTDPGGWNVEAVEQGGEYIPAANLEVPPGAVSPYVVPAREVPPLPPGAPLLDAATAAKIILTGLMRQEDRASAEAMARAAGDGRTAVFDNQAGWLLLPADPRLPATDREASCVR